LKQWANDGEKDGSWIPLDSNEEAAPPRQAHFVFFAVHNWAINRSTWIANALSKK
jgi:hypothetical protein